MTDIFNNETIVAPTLSAFVGEGKKYVDNDAVAKALVEKDAFITRLLEEKRRVEADLQSATNTKAFEDRMAALEAAQTQRAEPPVREVAPPVPVDIEAVVQKALLDKENENLRTRNLMSVKDKLTEIYGEEYPNRVKARAAELNISMDRLNVMAAETPSAFYALLGLGNAKAVGDVAPPATRQNAAATFTPSSGVKNNAYYQNMRKTNPTLYHSPAIQMEEYNELKRQGDAFGL